MKEERKIYYYDELNEEFSKAIIKAKKIDGNYKYDHTSIFKKFTHFFWYRIIATPIAYIYTKIVFGHKIKNKKVLKPFYKKGYFLYGNHTQDIADAFIPSLLNFPQQDYVIVHPNNVSMPFLGKVTPSMGAIPIPDDIKANRNFINYIEKQIKKGNTIVIYPEAHIWPYYTKIRPFLDISFNYPIRYNTAVFCFTNTYQKRKLFKRPRIVSYIDGPFYPDKTLSLQEQKKRLRNQVYECMVKRSNNSNIEYIKYIKGEKTND